MPHDARDRIDYGDCVTLVIPADPRMVNGKHFARLHLNTEALPPGYAMQYEGTHLTVVKDDA